MADPPKKWFVDTRMQDQTFMRAITAVKSEGLQISGNRGFDINSFGLSPSPLEVNYRKSDIPRVKIGFY